MAERKLPAIMYVSYLRSCSIEGDSQERTEAQTSRHRQRHQQDSSQPHGTLRLGTVPPKHGQTRIRQLGTDRKTITHILAACI